MASPRQQQHTMETDNEYLIEVIQWKPRVFHPPNWVPTPSSRVPSDVANSEPSQKALGDPERYRNVDLDYPSDKSDNGEASEAAEPERRVRSPISTLDSSTDTSLEEVKQTSSIVYEQPRNEILYLQVLTNGETRVVQKPGVLPMALHIDSATSPPSEEPAVQEPKDLEPLEEKMEKLTVKEGLRIRFGAEDVDDFFMEG